MIIDQTRAAYQRTSDATWVLIREAYLAGGSAAALARHYGIKPGAIHQRARRGGWTKKALAEANGPKAAWTAMAPPEPEPRPFLDDNPQSLEAAARSKAAAALSKGDARSAETLLRVVLLCRRLQDNAATPSEDELESVKARLTRQLQALAQDIDERRDEIIADGVQHMPWPEN